MVAPIGNSTSLWIELMKLLMQGKHDTADSTFRGRSSPLRRHQDRVAFARAQEAPHAARIEAAIDRWLATERWPHLSPEETYHTNLRFGAVLLFLTGVFVSTAGDSTTIFPFPEMSQSEVARWMLIDWWRAHGHGLLCSLADPHQTVDDL